jgi:hypothetical protein
MLSVDRIVCSTNRANDWKIRPYRPTSADSKSECQTGFRANGATSPVHQSHRGAVEELKHANLKRKWPHDLMVISATRTGPHAVSRMLPMAYGTVYPRAG